MNIIPSPAPARRQWLYRLGKLIAKCPACGRRTFKPYLRPDGSVLHPTVGRCNREIKCAYHLKPREYFAQNQITDNQIGYFAKNRNITKEYNRHNDNIASSHYPTYIKPEIAKVTQEPRFIDLCPLRRFFEERFQEATSVVFRLYKMGVSRRFGGSPIFWLYDEYDFIRSGKIMAYDEQGHRRKDIANAVMWIHRSPDITEDEIIRPYPSQYRNVRTNYNLRSCFFGAHIAKFPNTTVILVESEKTALYLACWMLKLNRAMYLRYVVLATGGVSNLTSGRINDYDNWHRFRPLTGKDVILIPDCDATEAWRARIPELMLYCRSVRLLDIRPWCDGPSDDVMDLLEQRRNRQLR